MPSVKPAEEERKCKRRKIYKTKTKSNERRIKMEEKTAEQMFKALNGIMAVKIEQLTVQKPL